MTLTFWTVLKVAVVVGVGLIIAPLLIWLVFGGLYVGGSLLVMEFDRRKREKRMRMMR